MAKAIKEVKKRDKKVINRKGIVAKTKTSSHKGSKLYKKKYRGQGR